MATPKKTATDAPKRTRKKKLSQGAGGAGAAAGLRLDRSRGPWTFMASPSVLYARKGEPVPRLAKAWHTPGHNGNGKDDTGRGAIMAHISWGYVVVPHELEGITAFGEPVEGDESNYLVRHVDPRSGHVYYEDVWHRPRQLGHITVWDYDEEGYNAFLCKVRDEILGGLEDEETQVDIATRSALEAVERLRDRKDARSKKQLAKLISDLPPHLVPADLREEGATE